MKNPIIDLVVKFYKAKRWIRESKLFVRLTDDKSGRGIATNEDGRPEWSSRSFFDVEDAARASSTAGVRNSMNAKR